MHCSWSATYRSGRSGRCRGGWGVPASAERYTGIAALANPAAQARTTTLSSSRRASDRNRASAAARTNRHEP